MSETTKGGTAMRRGWGFTVVNTLMLWIATAIASFALWPIYRSEQLVWLVVVVTIAGSAIAIAGARLRWSPPVVILVSVAAFLALGVPLAVPRKALFGVLPTLEGVVDLLAGVALGWKQLLTISLPVGDYEALLVPFFALILALTVTSLSIALRSRRGETAVAAPLVLFVTGIVFGPSTGSVPVGIALALVASMLLWVIWWRWYRRRTALRTLAGQSGGATRETASDNRFVGMRTLAGAVVILAVAAAAAAGATAMLPPQGDRQVLRTTIDQPFEPHDFVSPLAGFRRYWQEPNVNGVMLAVRGLPEGARIRIATLDTYDGVVYSLGSEQADAASGRFSRVPSAIEQETGDGIRVRLEVQVERYGGVWVPSVGDFERIDFAGERGASLQDSFYYNDTTGTAAVIAGLAAGDSYSIDAVLRPQPTEAQLRDADAGSAPVPAVAGLPAELSLALNEYVEGAEGQGGRLVSMIEALREAGHISHGVGPDEPPSRSGHATDRISQLLTEQRMIGDAEQYAVTAALMARELGFPARVVMGFAPEDAGGGMVEIRGSDISAWVEVNTAQYGWVAIDPVPAVREIPAEEPQDPALISRPQTIVAPPVVESERFDRQTTPDIAQDDPSTLDPFVAVLLAALTALSWTAFVTAILLSPFAIIIAAKVRRLRLRRTAPTPLEQISGGWREFEDALVDHGFSPPLGATRSEIATAAGGGKARLLASVSDRAVFAPTDPPDAEAERVWRAVLELTAALNTGKSRWQRMKARVSLRSLGGYSVRNLFKR